MARKKVQWKPGLFGVPLHKNPDYFDKLLISPAKRPAQSSLKFK